MLLFFRSACISIMQTTPSFYWHDYETFGLNRRTDRPAQFAGLRTTMDFEPMGETDVWYARPALDYLPQPEACLVTGITPQEAFKKGMPEAEFASRIYERFNTPGTIVVGYNNLRFDDEVTRAMFWRNLYDMYAHQYKNGCSRWDLCPFVLAVWALRDEGINWPLRETSDPEKAKLVSFRLEKLTEANVDETLSAADGVVICPGFGQRGIEGKFIAAEYTRTHDIPTFGICLGMQCMAIEFARDVLGYKDANSVEMDEKTRHNVIDLMEEQKSVTNMGGTMRLGAYECCIRKGSKAYEAYGAEHIQERHRHRYEFNNEYKAEFEKHGMACSGINPESDLVEIIEIPTLKWYIGVQFHPEYSSTILHPHPLFLSFVKAAVENQK